MAKQSGGANGGTAFPDYSGIGVMSEEDQRFYREITENTTESKRERINMIRNSGKSILEQINELSHDPYAGRDIVAYILQNGPYIIHFLKPSSLTDEQGNDFIDFVESDSRLYFQEIVTLLKELEKPQYTSAVKNNKDHVRSVKRAAEMWQALLGMREEAGELLTCGDEEPDTVFIDDDASPEACANAYNMAKDFVMSCAKWELGKAAAQGELVRLHVQGVVKKYVAEQKELLQSYFCTYMRNVKRLIPLVDWNGSDK